MKNDAFWALFACCVVYVQAIVIAYIQYNTSHLITFEDVISLSGNIMVAFIQDA